MYFTIGKPKSINELKSSHDYIKNVSRDRIEIAIIDDEPFQYLEILRNHNFHIRPFEDIADIKAVHAYPIVLCDIKGVGKSFHSKYEGAHIIDEVRKHYPSKIIIAYSGHQFDPSFNKYFQMCDFVLKKDIDSDNWVENLDNAISKAMNPITQWFKIRAYLLEKDVPLNSILKLEDDYVEMFFKKKESFPSNKTLNTLSDDVKSVILNFTSSAIFKLLVG